MSIEKDKILILNRIKLFYKFSSNAELARFLEVAPTTLSSWYSRNTLDYDLILTKCVEINTDWLLFGRGPMINENIDPANNLPINRRANNLHDKIEISSEPNSLIITEDELRKRIIDLEQSLEMLRHQLMYFAETWWHLLNIDYDWIPLKDYIVPNKTFEYAKEEGSRRPLIKDGLVIKVYDTFTFEEKVKYYKELETLRINWAIDLGYYIKQVYYAVESGNGYLNELITGDDKTSISAEKIEEINKRLLHFTSGKGMSNIRQSTIRKRKNQ